MSIAASDIFAERQNRTRAISALNMEWEDNLHIPHPPLSHEGTWFKIIAQNTSLRLNSTFCAFGVRIFLLVYRSVTFWFGSNFRNQLETKKPIQLHCTGESTYPYIWKRERRGE